MKKKKNKEKPLSDHGPVERQQHGEYVEIETSIAGVTALRNFTIDPIETYRKRKSITLVQYNAADMFARQYRKANLAPAYSHVRFDHVPVGGLEDEVLEQVHQAKQIVREALKSVGYPLATILEFVVGDCHAAGHWDGVRASRRPNQDGMVALRLALDGLVSYYRM